MVRVYDEALWKRLRQRGLEEERTVGLIVENAIKLYLGTPVEAAPDAQADPLMTADEVASVRALLLSPGRLGRTVTLQPQIARNDAPAAPWELARTLQALVDRVPAERPAVSQAPEMSARERIRREAEAREYFRNHPEEEEQ